MSDAKYDAMKDDPEIHCHASVDARGLSCPMPLMEARRALMLMEPGQKLLVLATDPASMRDFEDFTEFSGHLLLDARQVDNIFRFILEKG